MTAAPACRHCGTPLGGEATEGAFCCAGCAAAHHLIETAGLAAYYRRRPAMILPRPDPAAPAEDLSEAVRARGEDEAELSLLVEGVQCGACVWLIESLLARQPGLLSARVNLTSRRLTLRFRPAETDPERLLAPVRAVGYRLVPYAVVPLEQDERRQCHAVVSVGVGRGDRGDGTGHP